VSISPSREPHPAPYRVSQWIARSIWGRFAGLEAHGTANVPRTGPFILIANHASNLDPILIQAVCPRPVHAMAKSTQFAVPVIGGYMLRLLSFPVRRSQTDPQAVRIALRRLAAGFGVCVYIEGERSWDGRLQKARPGTVRLALKAGVPVVPVGISGSYDAWPRWSNRPQLLPVRVRFGPALEFPRLDRRADREAARPEATVRVMQAIDELVR
jgi:1-acyl-sn-glycerol-3-phosphate acyltransferase